MPWAGFEPVIPLFRRLIVFKFLTIALLFPTERVLHIIDNITWLGKWTDLSPSNFMETLLMSWFSLQLTDWLTDWLKEIPRNLK
jgi:hypothetical protein